MTLSSLFGGGVANDGSSGFNGSHVRLTTVSQNAVVVKNTSGYVGFVSFFMNQVYDAYYLKFYDKNTLPTSVDTRIFICTADFSGSTANGYPANFSFPKTGMFFQNGISYRITTGAAFNDTGNTAADGATLTLLYTN